jgi:putative ABC transport system substrate-binding protein
MPLSRRRFTLIALGAALAPRFVTAAPPDRVVRIGKLTSGEPPRWAMINDAIEDGLRELGYVEGKNLHLIKRTATYPDPRMEQYVRELVDAKVDVIVTSCMWTTSLARKYTSTIPIVIGGVHDPVGKGFVSNLARPEANVTGHTGNVPQLAPKMLEYLRMALPEVRAVGLLTNPKGRFHDARLVEALAAGRSMQLTVVPIDMHRLTTRAATRAVFKEAGVQALTFLVDDDLFFSYLDRINPVADELRLPVLYTKRDFVDLGGLMSFGPDYVSIMKSTAGYVDRILGGTRPTDLPVAQPAKLEFALNLRRAAELGIEFPRAALLRAEYVVR